MRIYGIPGQSVMQVGGDPEPGWLEMQGQRPGPEYIAGADGVWSVPAATFAQLQARKLDEINAAFSAAVDQLTAGYPEGERLTWAVQQSEALAWAANAQAPTPYLEGLAAARGISAEEMRQKTLAQTQLFMAASQDLVGRRQRLRDLVDAATSESDLAAISWEGV